MIKKEKELISFIKFIPLSIVLPMDSLLIHKYKWHKKSISLMILFCPGGIIGPILMSSGLGKFLVWMEDKHFYKLMDIPMITMFSLIFIIHTDIIKNLIFFWV